MGHPHPLFSALYGAAEMESSSADPGLQLRELMLLIYVHVATMRRLQERYGMKDETASMAAREGLEAIASACEGIQESWKGWNS